MYLLCVVFEKSAIEIKENSGCECLGDPLNTVMICDPRYVPEENVPFLPEVFVSTKMPCNIISQKRLFLNI